MGGLKNSLVRWFVVIMKPTYETKEGRLTEQENRFEQLEIIYETAPVGIALVDEKLHYLTCNTTFKRKLGFSFEELQTKDFLEICHPWDRIKTQHLIVASKDHRIQYMRDEIRLQQKAGTYLWVEFRIHYIPPAPNKPGSYIIMIQNIQQRKEMQQELTELRRHIHHSMENERKILAQELHDGPMQDLHSISFQIAAIIDDASDEVRQQLELIWDTVKELNKELRAISYNLRPPALSKFGLARSIKSHADELSAKYPDLTIHLNLVSDHNMISEEVSIALFRIYQHSIMNVIRHAGATEATVTLNMDGDVVTLEIEDNGSGFVVPEKWISLVRGGHYGLAGTSERVHDLGGIFKVDSELGKGTHILVKIPDYLEI